MKLISLFADARTRFRSVTLLLALVFSGIILAGSAHAEDLVFNLPSGVDFLGSSYSQDGYTFTNSYGGPDDYGNWVAIGEPSYNAAPTPDIFQNYGGSSNTITNDSSTPFSFTSIGLADVYNEGIGGDVQFTFNYSGGGSSSETVDLTSGIFGLQTFTFDQNNLTSVVFTPTTTEGPWIQFDDIGLSGSSGTVTPEPSSFLMFGSGLLGLAFVMRKKITRRTT